jgi:hypothetical protein
MPVPFPDDVRQFVKSIKWTFAKTYAGTWPHEYVVRDQVDEELFLSLVQHIRSNG